MDKLVLIRKDRDVYFENKKLPRVDQSTKGPGNEVIKIDGLPNSNGKKWISLNLLAEGVNELTCTARDVTRHAQTPSQKRNYVLNADEQHIVTQLQAQIDAIINAAKARFIPKPDLNCDPSKMTLEEREAKAAEIRRYFGLQ